MPSSEEKRLRRTVLRQMRKKEHVAQEEYLDLNHVKKRFFVFRRDETFCEVQILNQDGTARLCVTYTNASSPLEISEETVPVAVLQAGTHCLVNQGDYVNEQGESISW